MAKLLLVEDDSMIRKMLALRLRIKGHDVDEAENGKLGLEAALKGGYDLVLMDMHMPVMDGHEATRELRKMGYTGVITAVTASAMSEDAHTAIEAGCNYFIPKPIGEDFEDQIQSIIDASEKE